MIQSPKGVTPSIDCSVPTSMNLKYYLADNVPVLSHLSITEEATQEETNITSECILGYCRENNSKEEGTPEVPLHATLAGVERVPQSLNEIMAEAEVKCERHGLEKGVAHAVCVAQCVQ